MIISCPECGAQISDKAASCPQCGFPINSTNSNELFNLYILANGTIKENQLAAVRLSGKYGITTEIAIDIIQNSPYLIASGLTRENVDFFRAEIEKSGFKTNVECSTNTNRAFISNEMVNAFRGKSNMIICPRCGSTAITTGSRGFSLVWGFLGSGSTVNRCGNCGHTWKP